MENGGKRKRVALSLKSFKKPALNRVLKQPINQRLDEAPTNKMAPYSGVETFDLTRREESNDRPISQNRLELLKLMPTFPNWDNMLPLPLSPLVKSLIEQKRVDEPVVEINKQLKNKNYVDLPKLGNHYRAHRSRVEALMSTCTENNDGCMETDELKSTEIGMKMTEIAERGISTDKCKQTDLKPNLTYKNEECKQTVKNMSNLEPSIEEWRSKLKNSSSLQDQELTDRESSRPSQTMNSTVPKDDVDSIYNIDDDFDIDIETLEFCEPSSVKEGKKYFQEPQSIGKTVDASTCRDVSKPSSFYNTSQEHGDARKTLNKAVQENQDTSNRNSLYDMTNEKQQNLQTTQSMRKPLYTSKDISKSSNLHKTGKKHGYLWNTLGSTESLDILKLNKLGDKEENLHGNRSMEKLSKTNRSVSNAGSFYKSPKGQKARESLGKTVQQTRNISKVNCLNIASKTKHGPDTTSSFCNTSDNLRTSSGLNGDYLTTKDTSGDLGSSEDLFGDDGDDFDEILAQSFTDDLEDNNHEGNNKDSEEQRLIKRDLNAGDDGVDDLIGNFDDDVGDDVLVACYDDVMSPTIPVRENIQSFTSRISGRLNDEKTSKGVKRRLNIPDSPSKVRRSDDPNKPGGYSTSSRLDKSYDRLKECPLCAKVFHSRISNRDIDQHIAICCGSEEIGKDDAFW